jgi:Pentapeptide repeats (8 copies).
LCSADLRKADLMYSNFWGADLRETNLYETRNEAVSDPSV